MLAEHRRLLGWMFVASLMAGALLGYRVLQHRPLELRMMLVALASGFLITTVAQGIIPEANREGEPGFAGVLYIGGLSLYAVDVAGAEVAPLDCKVLNLQYVSERNT